MAHTIYHYIFWFKVSVNNTFLVQKVYSRQNFCNVKCNPLALVPKLKFVLIVQDPVQGISLKIFKNETDPVLVRKCVI